MDIALRYSRLFSPEAGEICPDLIRACLCPRIVLSCRNCGVPFQFFLTGFPFPPLPVVIVGAPLLTDVLLPLSVMRTCVATSHPAVYTSHPVVILQACFYPVCGYFSLVFAISSLRGEARVSCETYVNLSASDPVTVIVGRVMVGLPSGVL